MFSSRQTVPLCFGRLQAHAGLRMFLMGPYAIVFRLRSVLCRGMHHFSRQKEYWEIVPGQTGRELGSLQ